MRGRVRFVRNGRVVEPAGVRPDQTLLDYLRLVERATGTKEGCGEGDCGACTVAVGRLHDGALVYEPVNACIQLVGQVDGCDVVTVEDLAADDGTLHPVQAEMVEKHGSQCGFCTPGMVMSLFTLYRSTDGPVDRATVNDWIAGNLCRCTGYRPIVDAAIAACAGPRAGDRFPADETTMLLREMADREDVFLGSGDRFFAAPASLDALTQLYADNPDATILSGGTDVGLWITKQLRELKKIIHVGRVPELRRIEATGSELRIGAATTYAEAEPYLAALDPDIGELVRRLGSKQVRSRGTVGGNIANGSPIGDTPPVLIALGASVELRRGPDIRRMPVEDFYVEYGRQARLPGELLTAVLVPRLEPDQAFRCHKVTKRFDQDISSVLGAFRLSIDPEGRIAHARIAYGGMAGVPKRAAHAEAALRGRPLRDPTAWADALSALRDDFAPIDDHRASARYRGETAHALLGKALIEIAGTDDRRTRLIGFRSPARDPV